ncbi:PREDICTED: MHC class I polypeptide-related sequence B isoform X2 [Mandrillus leucophaeus]|uniref:MHC class I polypeptide-related sequence B n=1 Tax=Mandrillus leucophaeus TaxID=9568 RepID=A0A2K5XUZ5_MANLE|nr:PREDICTED: MHC class I polypeptide-related sequence B isoform X2 [Mandrillus leucophaeus]
MGPGRVLLFLASIFPFARPGAAAELHSLRYNITVLSQDGSVQSEFLAEGHLDSQLFVRYDRETRRARPQGQWAEAVLGDQETEDLTENAQDLRRTLTHIEGQKGVAQSSRAQTLAMNFWKEDTMKTNTHYRAMRADCLKKLRRYQKSRVAVRRTVPPMVNVTHGEASEDNITVTCRASGFYPGNITLTWRQDGVSLSHDAQQWGDVLPDQNGTYQTWVATRIRQGEEQRFACYMEHSGNHSTHPVPSGKPPVLQSERLNLLYVLVAVAVVTAFIIICVHRCKKKKTSAAEGPELVSLRTLDQHPVGTGDHRNATQLGFQPLMSAPGSTGSTEGA